MIQFLLMVGLFVGLAFLFPTAIPPFKKLVGVIGLGTAAVLGVSTAAATLATSAMIGFALFGGVTGTVISGGLALFLITLTMALFTAVARSAALAITFAFGGSLRGAMHEGRNSLFKFVRRIITAWAVVVVTIIVLALLQDTFQTTSLLDWVVILTLLTIAMLSMYTTYTWGTFRWLSRASMVAMVLLLGFHMFSSTQTARVWSSRATAKHQGYVNTQMGSGKSFYVTTRATKMYICRCTEDAKGNVTVHSLSPMQDVAEGLMFQGISANALPTEANGYPVIAVHPPINAKDILAGWNQNLTVLIPQTDVRAVITPRPTAEPTRAVAALASNPGARVYVSPAALSAPHIVEQFDVQVPASSGWVEVSRPLRSGEFAKIHVDPSETVSVGDRGQYGELCCRNGVLGIHYKGSPYRTTATSNPHVFLTNPRECTSDYPQYVGALVYRTPNGRCGTYRKDNTTIEGGGGTFYLGVNANQEALNRFGEFTVRVVIYAR